MRLPTRKAAWIDPQELRMQRCSISRRITFLQSLPDCGLASHKLVQQIILFTHRTALPLNEKRRPEPDRLLFVGSTAQRPPSPALRLWRAFRIRTRSRVSVGCDELWLRPLSRFRLRLRWGLGDGLCDSFRCGFSDIL